MNYKNLSLRNKILLPVNLVVVIVLTAMLTILVSKVQTISENGAFQTAEEVATVTARKPRDGLITRWAWRGRLPSPSAG